MINVPHQQLNGKLQTHHKNNKEIIIIKLNKLLKYLKTGKLIICEDWKRLALLK
jgi:hypothetical protein